MKTYVKYMLVAAFVFLAAACTKNEEPGDGMTRLSVSISMPGKTRADAYNALERSTLRIYKIEAGTPQLIRKYSPATQTPNDIFLTAGDYKVTVDAGDKSQATFTNKSYFGEQDFTLSAQQSQIVVVNCKITNIAVRVEYDQTVIDKLDKGYVAYVSAADEFSKTEAVNNSVPSLKYETKGTGFFLLPEGVSHLSWGFYGEGSLVGEVEKIEVIRNPVPGTQYTLTFKYSKTPDGFLSVIVSAREYEEKLDDNFIFSPQPTITGDGFSIDQTVGYHTNPIIYKLASIDAIMSVSVTANGVTYPILESGAPVNAPSATRSAANGITYTPIDTFSGSIEFGEAFFAQLPGGIHDLVFNMRDASGVEGKSTGHVARAGVVRADASNYDLWYNTASLKAIVTDPAASAVEVNFRSGEGTWQTLEAVKTGDFTFTATVNPTWAEHTNETGKTVYTRTSGIVPGGTYSYQLVLGGVATGEVCTFSPTTDQEIPYGDMNDGGLSSFGSKNDNAPYWASGNNSMAPELCTFSSFAGMSGAGCAKLAAKGKVTLVGLAAGNLFMGTFSQSGISGTASFGHNYAWKARPASLKLKYHATVGIVDYDTYGEGKYIPVKQQDKSRIMVFVIDWGSRHGVTSGVGGAKNTWDPLNGPDAVTEGKIIGYGSLFIDATTPGSSLVDLEIPIYYYDTEAKPSKTYTLSISCATSAYGDFMNGCSSNVMYVDDFEWGY